MNYLQNIQIYLILIYEILLLSKILKTKMGDIMMEQTEIEGGIDPHIYKIGNVT